MKNSYCPEYCVLNSLKKHIIWKLFVQVLLLENTVTLFCNMNSTVPSLQHKETT